MPTEEEKKEVEEKLEKKDEKKPIWQTTPPIIIIAIIVLALLLIRSMQVEEGNKNFILLLGVIGIIYLITHKEKPMEGLVTPKEADLLAEMEVERRWGWGQFPMMSKYRIGPVSDILHRDARGIYYNIAVTIEDPYTRPKYYIAKVMASGPERGFATLIKSTGELDGKKIHQERDWSAKPSWVKKADKYPILERWWTK